MVNIAGRSRGCSTCRRRRVKCDEKRPVCNRCERCGFQCGGMKEIAFIDCRKSMKAVKNGTKRTIVTAARDLGRFLSPPTSASLAGFQVQICICYTRHYLLRGGPIALALQDLQFEDLHFATDNTNTHLFHLSILSLSALFFGTQHRNTFITTHGYHLHGFALKKLNSALSDPQCQLRDDVLLTVIALVLQEAFVPTGAKYFLKHTAGLERLLELRGPSMLCSPESYMMFKSMRKIIILASTRRREPSILAREEWKDIPWDDESVEGHAEKYLFDVLADYTVLVSGHDRLRNHGLDGVEAMHQREDLMSRAQDLLGELYSWKAKWDTHTSLHFEHTTTPTPKPPDPHALPSTLLSQPQCIATTLMLYNTTLIYILQILASPSLTPSPNPSQNEYKLLQHAAALEISNLIPCHQAHRSQLDPGSLTIAHLAVRTAYLTLGGSGSEGGGWVMGLLGNSKGGHGEEGEVFASGLWDE